MTDPAARPILAGMSSSKDFYEILGVSRDADADLIKKSYRKLAMQFHPDKNPGDREAEDKFKAAAEAYGVLSDPEKRARYDRFGHAAFSGGGGPGAGYGNVEDIFQSFGDIFGDFFGGGAGGSQTRRRTGPQRGSDLRYLTEITLKDVVQGIDKEIEFQADESCDDCGGIGAEKGTKPVVCSQCGGTGQVVRSQGFFTMATTCSSCRGEGQVVKNPCRKCKGEGRQAKMRRIRLHIPAGVDNGTRLRVSGEGEGGYRGGPAGDLYVEVRVRPHELFQRRDEDLIAELEVPYLLLLLGGPMEVPTVLGQTKLDVPRGAQMGDDLRVPGEGLPSLKGKRRGDIHFLVKPVFPESLSKEEEKLLREVAKLQGLELKESGGLFGKKK